MDSLFSEGTPTAVKFLVAFAVVFALIALTAWLIRRFGTGALGGTGARGRAPRLAVIEAGAVDGRRKLVLIRRDNIEHLIMIGGPTDILVEANIVRGQSARDTATSRTSSAAEPLPRTAPAEETAWPLQPEAAPRNGRAARPAPLEDVTQWALPPEPTPAPPAPPKRSRSAETLAGLAAELSVRPSEPAVAPPPPPRAAAAPAAPVAEAPRAKPAQPPAAPAPAAADQNLADMASRLEAALRRPTPAPTATPAPRPAAAPAPKPAAEAPRAAPPIVPSAAPQAAPSVFPPVAPPVPPIVVAKEPAPAPVSAAPAVKIEPEKKAADDKPAKPGKSAMADDVFGSIEEEMANLLGRPGKPS